MNDTLKWLKDNYNISDEYLKKGIPADLADIITRMRTEVTDLKNELSFYKTAINSMQHPVFIKNDELEFVFLNEKYKSFFFTDEADAHHIAPHEKDDYHKEDNHLLESKAAIKKERVFKNSGNAAKESSYWSKGFVVPETGECGIIGEIIDISNEKRMQRDLSRQAKVLEQLLKESKEKSVIDATTNVYNRQIIKDKIPELLDQSVRLNIPICGALCDIDNFQHINEKYGHDVGDNILYTFAQSMRSTLREDDIIMRYGGDEFAVMLVGVHLDEAQAIAKRFLANLDKHMAEVCGGIPITVSIGMTKYKFGEDVFKFLNRLDESVYTAKTTGKNKIVVL